MAGQQQDLTRYRYMKPPQMDVNATPSVQAQDPQVQAGRIDTTGASQAIQGLSNSFGQFFQNLQGDAQRVNNAVEQGRLAQINDENQALAKQGAADYYSGKAPDSVNSQREDYWNSYQTAFATNEAGQMTQQAQAALRDMPKDGSVNPEDVVKNVWQQNYGTGTGITDFDSALGARFAPAAQTMVAQANEQIAQTQEQNNALAIKNSAVSQIDTPQGISEAGMATIQDRFLSLAKGDQVTADKMLLDSVDTGIVNETNYLGVDKALHAIGLPDRDPTAYAEFQQKAVARIQQVKSVDALTAVNNFQLAAYALHSNPNATAQDWANLAYKGYQIDSQYGVGMHHFTSAFAGLDEAAKRQVMSNVYDMASQGFQGSTDVHAIAAANGMSPDEIPKQFNQWAIKQTATNSQQFPALSQSAQGNAGVPNVLANANTINEATNWAASSFVHDQGGAKLPQFMQDQVETALKSNDPNLVAQGYHFLDTLRSRIGPQQFSGYLPKDDTAANTFYALDGMAPANGDVTQIAQAVREGGFDVKQIADATKTGSVNWQALMPGTKQGDIETKIQKGENDAMLTSLGRKGFLFNPSVSMPTDMQHQFNGLVMQQLMYQKANGSPDIDTAIKNAGTIFQGRVGATIGIGGVVKVIPRTGDTGYSLSNPINSDPSSPFSTQKGYAPVYAPGANIVNALGKNEDTLDTARSDMGAIAKSLPGIIPDGSQLSLGTMDASTGLSQVHDAMGQPIVFRAGEKLTVRRGDAAPDTNVIPGDEGGALVAAWAPKSSDLVPAEISADPQAAQQFFKNNLPPGFVAVYDQRNNQYALSYGYRVQVGAKEGAAIRAQRAAQFNPNSGQRVPDPIPGVM